MKVSDIAGAVEEFAPLRLAQSWDNVGLLIGRADADVRKVLLTIDITQAVFDEACRLGAELIISYHPTIWDGLKKITATGPGSIVYQLIRADIAVYSMHTALDAAAGGVNDGLAELVGIANPTPIGDYVSNPAGDMYKLVVFVPVEAIDRVAAAMFAAGAGNIGNYRNCGFGVEGTGTFLPLSGAKPAIGSVGQQESVREVRFESIVPAVKMGDVLGAMRKSHPYEMPAFDIMKLHDTEKFGLGRMGALAKSLTIKQIISNIKKVTSAQAVGFIGDRDHKVRKAAVCAGSCGHIINSVLAAGCDLYVTGELKHHQALAAQEAGLSVLCLSHSVSERFILAKLAAQLQKSLKAVTFKVSKKDADPFVWKNI